MITKLTIKTKNGKESTWTKEEAKELYKALHELFGTKETVVREYYKEPYRYPYWPYTTWYSTSEAEKTYTGAAISMVANTDAKTSY